MEDESNKWKMNYESLLLQYEEEKGQWEEERAAMQKEIEALQVENKKYLEKIIKHTKDQTENGSFLILNGRSH